MLYHLTMKILYITTDSTMAGTEKNVLKLACYMHNKGNHVKVFALKGNGDLIRRLQKNGIDAENIEISKFRILQELIRIRNAIKTGKYDIVHSFLFHANIISRLVKPKGIVLINSYRSQDGWKNPCHYFIERMTKSRADHLTINFCNNEVFKRKHGIKEILYIPNGIQKKNYQEPAHRPFIIGLIGRYHPVKGHIELIKHYLENPIREEEGMLFRFIGKGGLKETIKQLIEKRGLSERFEMRDHTEKEIDIYRGLSCVICVSEYEGFPNTLLEANSYGIPTLSFPIGDAPTIVESGKNGYIIKSFRELFERLIMIYTDKELFMELSLNAWKVSNEKFNLEKINSKYLELYERRQ